MTIAIGHSKGGVGKSTISWHLIFVLMQVFKKKVRILDLDFQQTIYFLNKIRVSQGLDPVEVIKPNSGAELLNILNDGFDGFTIIDLGGFDNDINRLALKNSDAVIIPIKNQITEFIGFQTFKQILGDIKAENIYMLLNNIHARTKDYSKVHNSVKNINANILSTVVHTNKKNLSEPLESGKHILETKKASNSRDELIALARELVNLKKVA